MTPLAEPLREVGIDRPTGRTDRTQLGVIRTADQFPVQPFHDNLGLE
ncbi:MAG: hypothetical protein AW06_000636 [Candidatus Accumulibacter cognatus]|uniref:Uncharacterized protein n=1 Tax=Candidatus Accumulibacter cognatus TaxID=2954383 RepID=A0A080M9W1_9PROT|nr:MAG: hypothetical protein AW06_000636 [Candidatus Accumulibacter cognatus]